MKRYLFTLLIVLFPMLSQALDESDFRYYPHNNPRAQQLVEDDLNAMVYDIMRDTQERKNRRIGIPANDLWVRTIHDIPDQQLATLLRSLLTTHTRKAHPNWQNFLNYLDTNYPLSTWDKMECKVGPIVTTAAKLAVGTVIIVGFGAIPTAVAIQTNNPYDRNTSPTYLKSYRSCYNEDTQCYNTLSRTATRNQYGFSISPSEYLEGITRATEECIYRTGDVGGCLGRIPSMTPNGDPITVEGDFTTMHKLSCPPSFLCTSPISHIATKGNSFCLTIVTPEVLTMPLGLIYQPTMCFQSHKLSLDEMTTQPTDHGLINELMHRKISIHPDKVDIAIRINVGTRSVMLGGEEGSILSLPKDKIPSLPKTCVPGTIQDTPFEVCLTPGVPQSLRVDLDLPQLQKQRELLQTDE